MKELDVSASTLLRNGSTNERHETVGQRRPTWIDRSICRSSYLRPTILLSCCPSYSVREYVHTPPPPPLWRRRCRHRQPRQRETEIVSTITRWYLDKEITGLTSSKQAIDQTTTPATSPVDTRVACFVDVLVSEFSRGGCAGCTASWWVDIYIMEPSIHKHKLNNVAIRCIDVRCVDFLVSRCG